MIVARRRVHATTYNAVLIGVINGVNTAYTTPAKFQASSIAVYYNGQRLSTPDDFSVTESAGAGTGFDTVTLLVVPRVGDHLLSDYIQA